MSDIVTTRLSSKGQVVIPEPVRERMRLAPGTRFVVVGGEDAIVLKPITAPSMQEFDDILAEARRAARAAGLRPADVSAAIRAVRSR